MSNSQMYHSLDGIAVIGMSGRFPGSRNVAEFWRNLRDGVESITRFTTEELVAAGVDPHLLNSPNYVPARATIGGVDLFDAPFFGFSPREAEIMDPHHRLFLEESWAALEDAGYDAEDYPGIIGVYGGMSVAEYLIHNLLPNRELVLAAGNLQLRILNDKDFLTSLAAYKLDLRGPSINVQTACSTSLVAVYLACQGLLSYQTDIALAGGVSVTVPLKAGYVAQEGVFSPDGHCRAFDAQAKGTVGGNGVGLVVLKRLADALEDGDTIHAVIKGAAINNDGAIKVGYTAPSVDGQAEVIALAQAVAGVSPATISYIEAHGTGTPIGDPIEVAALTQVFRADTAENGFCAVGSVKTNIGHLDASAGVASLIKTVLALKHKMIPPSLHFTEPNPRIDFADSPFYVNDRLTEWKSDGSAPRRAGVSAFAIGGVNAHVVVEEAPAALAYGPFRRWHLLVLSAKTESALEAATDNLLAHFEEHPEADIADVAYTLHAGRRGFGQRRMLVCESAADAAAALRRRDPKRVFDGSCVPGERPVAFMFPGLGNHYVEMALGLYQEEPVFREHLDHCCELLRQHLGLDLRDLLYPDLKQPPRPEAGADGGRAGLDFRRMLGRGEPVEDAATRRLNQTQYAQPALFAVEYALAQLWMKWGVQPTAMIGYSLGEYVAACLAGVFSLEDALALVARRAQMIQALPPGAMLAVSLPESEVLGLLGPRLSVAAVNGPSLCVVAGPPEEVEALEGRLAPKGVAHRRLPTTHAFHTRAMEPVVSAFTAMLEGVRLNPPRLPFISNVSGTWITTAQATDPRYWATHLCRPVRYGDGIAELWKESDTALLEVGPGQALGAWALQHPACGKSQGRLVLPSLRHSYDRQPDVAFLLTSVGKLWLDGAYIARQEFFAHRKRHRIPLPTYPFERRRYWIEPTRSAAPAPAAGPHALEKRGDASEWFYLPKWGQAAPLAEFVPGALAEAGGRQWLVFGDECGVGERLAAGLEREAQRVTLVRAGETFARLDGRTLTINPARAEDYDALLYELRAQSQLPDAIVHLWGVTPEAEEDAPKTGYEDGGFFSLLNLAKALGDREITGELQIAVVTNGVRSVDGAERLRPEKATVLGPCKVIPQEYPNFKCRAIDITLPPPVEWQEERLTNYLLAELAADGGEEAVAYRGRTRWVQTFEPFRPEGKGRADQGLREGGVYLITGGLGGLGLRLAEHLARAARARLVLLGRTPLPARGEWPQWLDAHAAHDPTSAKIRKVQELEALGAEVLCCRADVTERADVERALREAEERFGAVNGVIHAAGVQPGGMIQVKTDAAARSVLAPKVRGTLLLDELLRGRELDFFILCSSLNSLMGAFGLVDHCAANAFLDAFAHARHSANGTSTLSINWDAWLEVGQAANPTVSGGMRNLLEGADGRPVGHPLLDRCLVEEAEREVYVTELSTAKDWVVDEHRLAGRGVVPGTAYLEMARAAFAPRAAGGDIVLGDVLFEAPLLVRDGETKEVRTTVRRGADGAAFEFTIASRHDPAENGAAGWVEHVRGTVGVDGREPPRRYDLGEVKRRCREVLTEPAGDGTAAGQDDDPSFLRDGDFKDLPGLVARVRDAADPLSRHLREQLSAETREMLDGYGGGAPPTPLQTRLRAELNGLLLRESLYDERRFAHVALSEETLRLAGRGVTPKERLRLNRLLMEEAYPDEMAESLRARHLALGPRWEGLLRRLYVGQHEGLALIELPEEFAPDLEEFQIHPSLMDVATGFAQAVGEGLYLPLAYTKLVVKRPLPRTIYSHAKYKGDPAGAKETIVCDIVVTDEDGVELLQVEEFILRRVREVEALGASAEGERASAGPSPLALGDAPARADGDAPARGGRHVGLTPDEGAEAFARVLSMGVRVPQLAVSVRDLPALIEQVRAHTKAEILEEIGKLQSQRTKHPRPNIRTTYVEPANDMHRELAGIWEEMLVLEQVGIYDNFFDIGGDSLLATQLIARVAETFNVNISLSTLFEAPTIAELNVSILQKQAEQADDETLARLLEEVKGLSDEELQTRLAAEKLPAEQ